MTLTAVVGHFENQFSAALAGEPEIRAVGDTREAAVAALRAEVSQRIAEAVFAAMVQALPYKVTAAPAGSSGNFALGGNDPARERDYVMYQISGGGYGGNAGHDGLTDVFFLICCQDDRTHLTVLARLARLLRRPDFLDELRVAETPAEVWQLVDSAERELLEV